LHVSEPFIRKHLQFEQRSDKRTKWNPLLVFALLMMLVGGRVITVQVAGSYQVGFHLWRGAGFEGWTKTAVTPSHMAPLPSTMPAPPRAAIRLAATTIISFVPGVKIAFIELYCSGLTKKQTF
jgi:hypothetical protein